MSNREEALVKELLKTREILDRYSNLVGEIITEYHWRELCQAIVDIDDLLAEQDINEIIEARKKQFEELKK